MSDEQPDEEERPSLGALLNRHVPANPGKPRPWVPSDSTGYATQGDASAADAPAGDVTEDPATEPNPSEEYAEQVSGELRSSDSPRPATLASEFGAAAPADEQQSTGDLSALLADLGRLTSSMQGQLAGLQGAIESAKEQTYEAASADESVTVTVNGRPRVTHVSVSPKAIRGGPEALGAWVVEAVNAATSKARTGAQSALLDGLDPEMRAAVAAGIADATGNGTSTDNGTEAVRPWGGHHA